MKVHNETVSKILLFSPSSPLSWSSDILSCRVYLRVEETWQRAWWWILVHGTVSLGMSMISSIIVADRTVIGSQDWANDDASCWILQDMGSVDFNPFPVLLTEWTFQERDPSLLSRLDDFGKQKCMVWSISWLAAPVEGWFKFIKVAIDVHNGFVSRVSGDKIKARRRWDGHVSSRWTTGWLRSRSSSTIIGVTELWWQWIQDLDQEVDDVVLIHHRSVIQVALTWESQQLQTKKKTRKPFVLFMKF